MIPASFYTHVMRYCGGLGCRGHREPRTTPADYTPGLPEVRAPRKKPTPKPSAWRVEDFLAQSGRSELTPRQWRRVQHKRNRAQVES